MDMKRKSIELKNERIFQVISLGIEHGRFEAGSTILVASWYASLDTPQSEQELSSASTAANSLIHVLA